MYTTFEGCFNEWFSLQNQNKKNWPLLDACYQHGCCYLFEKQIPMHDCIAASEFSIHTALMFDGKLRTIMPRFIFSCNTSLSPQLIWHHFAPWPCLSPMPTNLPQWNLKSPLSGLMQFKFLSPPFPFYAINVDCQLLNFDCFHFRQPFVNLGLID